MSIKVSYTSLSISIASMEKFIKICSLLIYKENEMGLKLNGLFGQFLHNIKACTCLF